MMAVLAWALPVRGGVGFVGHGVAEHQRVAGSGVGLVLCYSLGAAGRTSSGAGPRCTGARVFL